MSQKVVNSFKDLQGLVGHLMGQKVQIHYAGIPFTLQVKDILEPAPLPDGTPPSGVAAIFLSYDDDQHHLISPGTEITW